MKTTEAGGVRGYDAGKKINGRKRHTVVDTTGMLFGLVVHAADVQDRDGAPAVLKSIRHTCPWLRHLFADGGYAGPKLRGALDRIGKWTLEIVKPLRHRQGLRSPASTVGRRTYLCMARAMSAAGKRLGEILRLQRGMDQHRPYPTHNAAARKVLPALNEFRVRL